jgi:dihydrofolate reductase
MGRLIYSMFTSLDGYASDTSGSSDWGGAADAELHDFVSEQTRSVGTYLYGRRMYETMSFWETALELPDAPEFVRRYAAVWQAASKVVYSTTLDAPTTARTTLQRTFDPEAVRAEVAALDHDVTVDGPTLAVHALRAGIVDEVQPYVAPVSVGGGLRFWPEGLRLDLDLLEERRFGNGTVWLRYAVRRD